MYALAAAVSCFEVLAFEPVPIPLAGDGVFGGAIFPDVWLDFDNGISGLRWMKVTWTWSGEPSSGAPLNA